jgi:hypothetical protein
MHPIAQEYFDRWIAPDGQGKLELDDEREGFVPESPRITRNENGQLFYVMTMYEFEKKNILPPEAKDNFSKILMLSRLKSGLFYRRYLDKGIRQSHDNIVGIAAGSVLFDTRDATDIAVYGSMNGWCFNVQKPEEWDIRCCIQGGDVAVLKILAGWIPTIWEMVWFFVGRLVVPKDAGKVNLSNLRFMALKKMIHKQPSWVRSMVEVSEFFFSIRHKKNGNYNWAIRDYFKRDDISPIIKAVELDNL